MKIRFGIWFTIAIAIVSFICLIPVSAGAQSIPRLANGKPDFTGIWDHPRVVDVTRDGRGCGGGTPGCTQKGSGELAFTPDGEKKFKGKRVDFTAYCMPWCYSRSSQVEYPLEIMHRPERMAFLYESNNIFHVIHTDGSDHPRNLEPNWMGHSVGKWEGDTLVIDTIGFNGKTYIDTAEHPSSDALHVTERISYADPQHLNYEITWEDSKMYTKPIKNTRVFSRMKPGDELMEYWCMENNKTLLEGHLPPLRLEQ